MFQRNIQPELRAALADTPVVLLLGARQTGKTTLAREVARETGATYVSFDDATQLAAAAADPRGFVETLGDRVVIDEAQKVPELFPAIKLSVDGDRRPGRFLLTGSANVLLLPKISESLAGRMEIIVLWPLSQGELRGRRERFIDAAFTDGVMQISGRGRDEVLPALLAGGYPEALERQRPRRREAWFRAYLTALVQRDVRDLASIEGLTEMPRLLSLLASRVGGLLNMSELSRGTGIPHTTLKRYLGLLHAAFIYQPVPAWSGHRGKRLVKSPKVHLLDAGLTAHLAGVSADVLQRERGALGPLLESFVVSELRKQLGWNEAGAELYHYRTTSGREVDIVIEDRAGRLVAIEVKAAATVKHGDFSGIRSLGEDQGKRLIRGIVLYLGDDAAAFGERMQAMPVSALWRISDPAAA